MRGLGGCLYYGGLLLFSLVVFGWMFYAWVWPVIKFLVLLVVLLLSPIWAIAWLLLMAVWPLLVVAAAVLVVLFLVALTVPPDTPAAKDSKAIKDDQDGGFQGTQ